MACGRSDGITAFSPSDRGVDFGGGDGELRRMAAMCAWQEGKESDHSTELEAAAELGGGCGAATRNSPPAPWTRGPQPARRRFCPPLWLA